MPTMEELRKSLGCKPRAPNIQDVLDAKDNRIAELERQVKHAKEIASVLISECMSKALIDPVNDLDANPDYNVSVTLSIGEIAMFAHALGMTAAKAKEGGK